MPEINHAYVGLDRGHLSFKEKRKGASMSAPTYPFRKHQFSALLDEIEQIVSDPCYLHFLSMLFDSYLQINGSLGSLDQFGSHFYVLEIKGCKAFTKEIVHEDTVKDAMQKALDNLREEFSGLDWEYMSNRRQGELFCDIGITYHAHDDEPLVGLWKLNCLEASFGAGGYLKGNIHNLNTLSLYGGLQSEMASERSKRTHILFRSSYNLAYEATRRNTNMRDLFKEKEVYTMDENFLSEANQVLSIFRDNASKTAYGVRDEFRVGYAAFDLIADEMDELVSLSKRRNH